MASPPTLKSNPARPPERAPDADASREFQIVAAAGDLKWIDAVSAEGKPTSGGGGGGGGQRRFQMTAYTGGPMQLPGWRFPVVVDLAGLQASAKPKVFLEHDRSARVGHIDNVQIAERTLDVAGVVSASGKAAQEVLADAANGFPWQASIGAKAIEVQWVPEGQTAQANGQTFRGPVNIARKSLMGEVSFVALGADDNTTANIAPGIAANKESTMPQSVDTTVTNPAAAPLTAQAQTPDPTHEGPDPVKELRAQAAAESRRITAVRKICNGSGGGQHADLEAQAIAEGWDENKTELAVLRAQRPRVGAVTGNGQPADASVLEAALRLGGQESESVLVAQYGAQTVQRAHPLRKIGLRKLIDACCQMEGRDAPGIGASESEIIRAAFSTNSLPGILSNVAHKTMLAAYTALPGVARLLARKLTVSDFKQHTGYRLTGDMTMQEIGPDGELKHSTLGETSFTYQAKTYGRMFGLTRTDLINDDLGAFMEVPRLIGRGAALALEEAFWTLVLANTGTYFGTGNKNYISGATTVLGPEGLEQAVQKFLEQTDADGKPIVLNPRWLLVPPPLKVTADQLYKSTVFNTGGAATASKVPNANVFAGLYEPVVTPYLSNAAFTGYSATAWYLWGDPADVAAFGICYLNGNEAPTIEDAPPAPQFLGQGWRGYFDFGVCQIDARGAVKSKGAA